MTSWESFNMKAFYRVFSLIITMAMGPVTHLLKAPSALFFVGDSRQNVDEILPEPGEEDYIRELKQRRF